MINSIIVDPSTGVNAKISEAGELLVRPLDYSLAYSANADVINTGYNLVPPIAGSRFIITAILLTGNKNISATVDANVVIYEATSTSTTTSSRDLLPIEIAKSSVRDITGIRLSVRPGYWVNIKTDDDDVRCTILGYYSEFES